MYLNFVCYINYSDYISVLKIKFLSEKRQNITMFKHAKFNITPEGVALNMQIRTICRWEWQDCHWSGMVFVVFALL